MTFKGMLKIVVDRYRKQHEEKMYPILQELLRARRELEELKAELRSLKLNDTTESSSEESDASVPRITLYVQYRASFNRFYGIRQTMTVENLLDKIRQLMKIPSDLPVRLRVRSKDGLRTVCFLDEQSHRTLESYNRNLKSGMILSIEEDDRSYSQSEFTGTPGTDQNEQSHSSFNETDV